MYLSHVNYCNNEELSPSTWGLIPLYTLYIQVAFTHGKILHDIMISKNENIFPVLKSFVYLFIIIFFYNFYLIIDILLCVMFAQEEESIAVYLVTTVPTHEA